MLLISPYNLIKATTPPLGLAYIAAILEKTGEEVKLIDCRIERIDKKKLASYLKDHLAVGVSVNIGTIKEALNIAKLIREISPRVKIIMGGPQASVVYDKLIPQYADIVVIGEGEDTIRELVKSEGLSKIRGIAYWDGNVKVNEPRTLIADLDRLPYPAWHLFPLDKYNFREGIRRHVNIITSRGCPYQCIYCTKHIHGSEIRLRSVGNIIGEIEYLVSKININEIMIWDDNFTFYPERVKELCKEIIRGNYKNLHFSLPGGIRADKGDYEMFKLMLEAGFYWVALGIESGSQKVSDRLGRNLNLKSIRDHIEMLKLLGFKVTTQFMIGLPFDNVNTMQETIDFAKNLPADSAHIQICLPFPGTKLYEMVQKKGRFLQDLTLNSSYFFSGKASYEIEELKAIDVEKMYRKAYRQLYFRPRQLWHILNKTVSLKDILAFYRERKNLFRL